MKQLARHCAEDRPAPGLLRGGFTLLVGRQTGALAFTGALVLLARLADRPVFDAFVWAYTAELLVSSILNLGLERLTANRVGITRATTELPGILAARLLSLPLTAVAVAGLIAFVHVDLPVMALTLTVVWTAAVQVQGVLFAALRAMGRPRTEAGLAMGVRGVQAAALLTAAALSGSVTALVAVVAFPEVVLGAWLVLRVPTSGKVASPSALPMRLLGAYTLIEVLAFAYLRVDALVIGRLLGPGPGATYVLAYRILDGLTALLTPFLLYLFPAASRAAREPGGLRALRRSLLGWAPVAATTIAAPILVASDAARHLLVERFAEAGPVLLVLVVTLPLYAFSAIELHLRSAEGRNRLPIAMGAGLIVLNVGLNVVLVPRSGIVAAAWVLVACELLQAIVLAVSVGRVREEPGGLARAAVGVTLLGVAAALAVRLGMAAALAPLAGALVVSGWSAVVLRRDGPGPRLGGRQSAVVGSGAVVAPRLAYHRLKMDARRP